MPLNLVYDCEFVIEGWVPCWVPCCPPGSQKSCLHQLCQVHQHQERPLVAYGDPRYLPVAQAVDTAWFGPRRPYLIPTAPAAMLTSMRGTKYGDTRRSLLAASRAPASAISLVQLIPAPKLTPVEVCSARVLGCHPESCKACIIMQRHVQGHI
jgi:hypothetical protein